MIYEVFLSVGGLTVEKKGEKRKRPRGEKRQPNVKPKTLTCLHIQVQGNFWRKAWMKRLFLAFPFASTWILRIWWTKGTVGNVWNKLCDATVWIGALSILWLCMPQALAGSWRMRWAGTTAAKIGRTLHFCQMVSPRWSTKVTKFKKAVTLYTSAASPKMWLKNSLATRSMW